MAKKSHAQPSRTAHAELSARHNAFSAGGCSSSSTTALRGVDLVEQIALSSKIQKQRWIEIYTKLWERKAKVDIADAIVIHGGTPRAWYFTSSSTGEVLRKRDERLNAIAIKQHFVRRSDPTLLSRQLAVLVHEDRDGGIRYSTLSDLEFNTALCQPSSQLWMSSFLLQPFTPASRQHPLHPGTFVAKYNALATTACVRVLQTESYFYDIAWAAAPVLIKKNAAAGCETIDSSSVQKIPRPKSAASAAETSRSRASLSRPQSATSRVASNHQLEEIVKTELRTLVREIESAFKDKLRLLNGEFQVTSTNRLVLLRVSHVVFFSDLKKRDEGTANGAEGVSKQTSKTQRPSSASSYPGAKKCAGGHFCHCKIFASAAALRVPLPSTHEFQRITRKSLHLSDEESKYLELFGAHAEAKLLVSAMAARSHSQDAFTKLLQRRIFMLQSTLWNPKSDAFKVKPLEFQESKLLPQQYEMIQVCKTCYLIYHTIDGERFQASRSTSKAAARLYNAKAHSSVENAVAEAATWSSKRSPSRVTKKTRAWEDEEGKSSADAAAKKLGTTGSPATKMASTRLASSASSSWMAMLEIE